MSIRDKIKQLQDKKNPKIVKNASDSDDDAEKKPTLVQTKIKEFNQSVSSSKNTAKPVRTVINDEETHRKEFSETLGDWKMLGDLQNESSVAKKPKSKKKK